MRDKYLVPKKKKPESKQDFIEQEIEALIKRRDATQDPAEKQKINAEITTLFAQYQRLKL